VVLEAEAGCQGGSRNQTRCRSHPKTSSKPSYFRRRIIGTYVCWTSSWLTRLTFVVMGSGTGCETVCGEGGFLRARVLVVACAVSELGHVGLSNVHH